MRRRSPQLVGIAVWGLASFAAARAVLADPAPAEPRACAVASRQEAKLLADRLYEKGDYQRAGECYEAAGDAAHADLALMKAVGPKSKDAARDLKAQADAAKSLFTQVGGAFHGRH